MEGFRILMVIFGSLFVIPIDSYRILAIFPFQSRSHQMMFDGITKGLAKVGHQIDVMTIYPLKNPPANYSIVVNLQDKVESLVNKWDVSFATNLGDDTLPIIAEPFGNGICEFLGLPEMQKIIKNPPKNPAYDLVIVESFGANCFIGLGYVLKVPVIMVSSTIDLPWLDDALGQPTNTAFFPAMFTGNAPPMSFITRFLNTIKSHINIIRYRYITDTVQNSQMKKYLDPNIPSLQELEKDVVLALVNSFHSLSGVRPVVPNIIEVAGLHVESNYNPLSKELEQWLNESTSGVIYFTLGSMVNIETFEEKTMRAIYSVFEKIAPVRVLMKVANKDKLLPGLPANIKTSSWIPQVAVLAHKNTRAFITHGGLMSSQEALTYGIPMIGIPLFGDQQANIMFYSRRNMALSLNIRNLTETELFNAVNEILNNPKYKKAAEFQSARFLDRPMSALDTAIYWTEYAIRNGPNSLRSPAVDMYWWQVALLDVYLFILFLIVTSIYTILQIIKIFMKLFSLKSVKYKKT